MFAKLGEAMWLARVSHYYSFGFTFCSVDHAYICDMREFVRLFSFVAVCFVHPISTLMSSLVIFSLHLATDLWVPTWLEFIIQILIFSVLRGFILSLFVLSNLVYFYMYLARMVNVERESLAFVELWRLECLSEWVTPRLMFVIISFYFFFHFVRWICIIIHVYVNEIVRWWICVFVACYWISMCSCDVVLRFMDCQIFFFCLVWFCVVLVSMPFRRHCDLEVRLIISGLRLAIGSWSGECGYNGYW